jgi:hypothetical protein
VPGFEDLGLEGVGLRGLGVGLRGSRLGLRVFEFGLRDFVAGHRWMQSLRSKSFEYISRHGSEIVFVPTLGKRSCMQSFLSFASRLLLWF